jgi:hypothetical protein
MDREEWRIVLGAVRRAARAEAKANPRPPRRPRYPDWLVVAMFLWACGHDRRGAWACDRSHYGGVFRPRGPLPSVSQFNRRMNEPRTWAVLQRVHDAVGGPVTATALTYLDGKPLTVGVASKDPDAKRGRVMGGFARGYKLHAWMAEDRRVPVWCVAPLNVHEAPVAELLVAHAAAAAAAAGGPLSPRSLALADGNYDARGLHKGLHAAGGRLLVWPKDGGRRARAARSKAAAAAGDAGTGTDHAPDASRHAVTLRQMGPARRELLAVAAARPGLVRLVHRHRVHAEGILGNLCGYGGGLTGLPPFVRRLHRVRRWVGGKIILYHARLRARVARRKAA